MQTEIPEQENKRRAITVPVILKLLMMIFFIVLLLLAGMQLGGIAQQLDMLGHKTDRSSLALQDFEKRFNLTTEKITEFSESIGRRTDLLEEKNDANATTLSGFEGRFEQASTKLDYFTQVIDRIVAGDPAAARDPIDPNQPIQPLKIRMPNEIAPHLNKVADSGNVEDFAKQVSEVDSWIFLPNDEQKASEEIDRFISRLSQLILDEVTKMDAAALAAASGEEAVGHYTKGTAILAYYPIRNNAEQAMQFEKFLKTRDLISRRIMQIRHLRYNAWAINQMEEGFKAYHKNLNAVKKWDDDKNLTESCANALKEIDADQLTHSSMEIYISLLKLTNESINEEYQLKLAKKLNDPTITKKGIEDF